ncbi:MAG: L,D-transpeptidase family protein [Thermomonas sp.]
MDRHSQKHTTICRSRIGRLRFLMAALTLASGIAFPAYAQDVASQTYAQDFDASSAPNGDVSPVDPLQPGDYSWNPERAADGQVVVVVSIPQQRAHVYRNGVRIGVSTVSTGQAGHPTPTGTFEILQKKVLNHSNLYNNAPMPYMQRLTWDGIALHAGKIPGYPASHGCIRLPLAFAKILYAETERGMLVVIADDSSHGPDVVYPGDRAPVDAYSGLPVMPSEGVALGIASAAP